MNVVVSPHRYFKVTGVCMKIMGIWPNENKFRHYFLRTAVYVILISSILAQLVYMVCFFDLETLTNQLFEVVTTAIALMKNATYDVKYSKFKVLFDGIIKDLTTDKTKEELDVMISCINKATFITKFYVCYAICIVMTFIQVPLVPLIADIVKPLNTSRPPVDSFHLYYYFFEIDESHYSSMIHTDITVVVISCSAMAFDNFYVYAVHHACGLFGVAGCRFKNAIEDIPDARATVDVLNETYRKVCDSIKAHNHAIRYVREIDNFYSSLLFIYVTITVIGFSTSLLWVLKLELSEEFYVHVASLSTELRQIVFMTLSAQFLINSTDDVYKKIYEALWYKTGPKTQVLFILALRSAVNPPQIKAGGLIPMNMETFAEVIKLSFSYCMVLRSVE